MNDNTKPRVYLSGRMSGLPGHNYDAFNEAAIAWRAAGWDVLNPAEHFGGATDRTYLEYIVEDAKDLKTADALAMLPGWDDAEARGSLWEFVIAQHLLGIPTYDASNKPVTPAEHRARVLRRQATRFVPPSPTSLIDENFGRFGGIVSG